MGADEVTEKKEKGAIDMPRHNHPRKRPDHTRRPKPTVYIKGKPVRPEDMQEDDGYSYGF